MKTAFDTEKNRLNIVKHGISFDAVEYFDWDNAAIYKDERKNYGEERRLAIQEMIVAETLETRKTALAKLLPFQTNDFYGIFKAIKFVVGALRFCSETSPCNGSVFTGRIRCYN